jgi:hypothetical protein
MCVQFNADADCSELQQQQQLERLNAGHCAPNSRQQSSRGGEKIEGRQSAGMQGLQGGGGGRSGLDPGSDHCCSGTEEGAEANSRRTCTERRVLEKEGAPHGEEAAGGLPFGSNRVSGREWEEEEYGQELSMERVGGVGGGCIELPTSLSSSSGKGRDAAGGLGRSKIGNREGKQEEVNSMCDQLPSRLDSSSSSSSSSRSSSSSSSSRSSSSSSSSRSLGTGSKCGVDLGNDLSKLKGSNQVGLPVFTCFFHLCSEYWVHLH